MVVKTFRGLLADGAQERIKLQTSTGKVGYRIVKFQLIPNHPFIKNQECTVKIYKLFQTTVNATTDFTDNDLLGVALFKQRDDTELFAYDTVVFDREIFNQDIYITHLESFSDNSINYYLELEVIPLASDEVAITTVKAMRGQAVD